MASLTHIRDYLDHQIWRTELAGRTPLEVRLVNTLRWMCALSREMKEGGLNYRAMSLVYTTLLSMAPLLAVSFSVLKAFGVHNQLEPLLLNLLAPLGEQGAAVADHIIGFVENIQVGVLGFVGFALLFYTVISLLEKIEDSFNRIWRVGATRGWVRRFSDYLSVILIGPVLVFSALGVMASMTSAAVVQRIIAREPFGTAFYVAGLIVPFLLIIAAFTFVYAFMPNTRVKLSAALVGGIVAGLAWKAVGWAFGAFVAQSASYSAIYSGFAIVIVFMIWLYVNWLILLLGGVVAFYYQHPRYLRYKSGRPSLSNRYKEYLGFLLMYLIGRSYDRGQEPWTLDTLAEAVSLPWEAVQETLQQLQRERLLVPLHTDPEAFLPARSLESMPLQEILLAVRRAGERRDADVESVPPAQAVESLLGRLDRSAVEALQGRTLRDLVREGAATSASRASSASGDPAQ